jgi:rod shape-determining protein MreD
MIGVTKEGIGRRRINRKPSQLLARSIPWASVMLGSVAQVLLLIASAPMMPPLGFLILLAWKQLRPGLLPVWAGLPLGLFDDLYSGQPMGSATLLWSIASIIIEIIQARVPWRNFLMEWLVAACLIAGYIVLSLGAAHLTGASAPLLVVLPQIFISVLIYPLIGRLVAALDRFRLTPFAAAG